MEAAITMARHLVSDIMCRLAHSEQLHSDHERNVESGAIMGIPVSFCRLGKLEPHPITLSQME